MSGLMSSAASIRWTSSRPPAIRPDSRLRVSSTAVSRSSVRSVPSRTRPASVRTAAQPPASSPINVLRGPCERPGTAVSSSDARAAGVSSAVNVVSTRDTRDSNANCWASAMAIAFSVVKVYCGGTALLAAAWAAAVWTLLSKSIARGARMSLVANSPTLASSACLGRMSAPRMAVMTRMRTPAAIASREASRRVNRVAVSARRVSIAESSAWASVCPDVVSRKIGGGEGLHDQFADPLAISAAADAG